MLQAYTVAADAFTSTPQERAGEPQAYWETRIGGPNALHAAFGAFQQSTLVAAVAVEFSNKPKTRHKAHLVGMFVAESARGLGAGKALVQAVQHCAKSRPGVKTMVLTVTEGNLPAINLYRACGFQEFGVEPMAILTPSGFKAKVHLWCDLENYIPNP